MKTKTLQLIFLILGFACTIFAAFLSFKSDYIYSDNGGGGVDIAADGGAAGFAILAGLCFVALSITTINFEHK